MPAVKPTRASYKAFGTTKRPAPGQLSSACHEDTKLMPSIWLGSGPPCERPTSG